MDLTTTQQVQTMSTREIAAEQAAQGITSEVARFLVDDIKTSTCDCTEVAIKAAARLAVVAGINELDSDGERLIGETILEAFRAIEFATHECACGSGWIAAAALKAVCATPLIASVIGFDPAGRTAAERSREEHFKLLIDSAPAIRYGANRRRSETKTYIVRNPLTGLIKIGKAVNPAARIHDVGHMAGAVLEVLALIGENIEGVLHRRFAPIRVHGEWFKDDGQIRAYCAALTAE